jgi:aminoglycoside phosphotransferase (APT) family kinase protein
MTAQINLSGLHPYLTDRLGNLGDWEQWQVSPITSGQSNPTWYVRTPVRDMVVRAKPGKVKDLLPSAHAIEREVRVQSAIAATKVPVPHIHCHCKDEEVIGVAFYVMDFVPGRVLQDTTLSAFPKEDRKKVHQHAMSVLAQLHAADFEALGLSDYGRHEGYAQRTISRWAKQYDATCVEPLHFMKAWTQWLQSHIPPDSAQRRQLSVVHGDYRLENLMFSQNGTNVVAVLDWELSTLGDPLSDLAYYCMAWHNPQGLLRGLGGIDVCEHGLPSEIEMVQWYCDCAGIDHEQVLPHWSFYLSLNYFRLTAILQGVASRVAKGQTTNPTAQTIGALTPVVAKIGWDLSQA